MFSYKKKNKISGIIWFWKSDYSILSMGNGRKPKYHGGGMTWLREPAAGYIYKELSNKRPRPIVVLTRTGNKHKRKSGFLVRQYMWIVCEYNNVRAALSVGVEVFCCRLSKTRAITCAFKRLCEISLWTRRRHQQNTTLFWIWSSQQNPFSLSRAHIINLQTATRKSRSITGTTSRTFRLTYPRLLWCGRIDKFAYSGCSRRTMSRKNHSDGKQDIFFPRFLLSHNCTTGL